MDTPQGGILILKTVPAGEVEKKVVTLLLKYAKTSSVKELTEKVRNTPYVISKDIKAEKAAIVIDIFKKCGATAVFVPHMSAKPAVVKFSPVQEPSDFTFRMSATDEEVPSPPQAKPRKNGARRLAITLIIILLGLCLGYLTWQLWPILGAKIREFISSLW